MPFFVLSMAPSTSAWLTIAYPRQQNAPYHMQMNLGRLWSAFVQKVPILM